eukprot:CAMPEP_0177591366 /NCGR_PEP_ID=MMETSP0419_2-20121207/7959_1 /TAXON_ID=582737 /ORGANISM="Tetraselmis sp., Strain GSL018" /LENGTH=131 /DNA_ID=CAMNT_0019082103 /DNA_START=75 /DNA_END=470 /DNA_ORIENTATION=-
MAKFLVSIFVLGIVFVFSSSASDLKIEVMKPADPCTEKAVLGKEVSVHYKGMLTDGTVFDESAKRGTPINFKLGSGQVISGWEKGIDGMCVGEKRKLTIPSHMAYGKRGVPQAGIPGDATLVFETELISVK